jgi:uncharacterized protein YkwD
VSRGRAVPSRRVFITLAGCLLAGVTAGPLATSAQATTAPSLTTFDSRLLYDINNARAARGIRKLVAVAGTTDIAHHWSCHQAYYLTLAHNLNLASQLVTHGSSLWTTYGENVGEQSSTYGADRLFRAYMNDAGHRANILDKGFRYVGLWSKRHDGRRYNTIDFVGSPISSYSYTYGATRVTC